MEEGADIKNNIRKKIFNERLRILHKNLFISLPANYVCGVVVFASLYITGSSLGIKNWFIIFTIITLLRLFSIYIYYQYPQAVVTNLTVFLVGVACSAALWGVVDSFLMPDTNLLEQMIVIVIIAGITAGGAQTLSASLFASIIYVSFIIPPLCIWLFLQNGLTYLALGIAMTAYLVFMLITSINGYRMLKKVLKLNYENLALVENLSVSNKKLVDSYTALERHENQIMIINRMNDFLQTCQRSEEAYEIILIKAKKLFKHFSGGLAILNPTSNHLETLKQWGDQQIIMKKFSIADCWALRKGFIHVADSEKDLICHHFDVKPEAYICIPLIVQSGILGVITLHTNNKKIFKHYQPELAANFCEAIQLALTNIKLRESLYTQSIHDPLTGLFNRRYLDETLIRELKRIERTKKTICVAMLDVDYFKPFNDANGHDAGDEVLRNIGRILIDNFRGSDMACRFGGEEFLVVITDADLKSAYPRLEHIRKAVKEAEIYLHGQRLPPVTISIGLAEAPRQGSTQQEIIHAADEALYLAKQAGRDCVKANDIMENIEK